MAEKPFTEAAELPYDEKNAGQTVDPEVTGRHNSVALNIVENPLKVGGLCNTMPSKLYPAFWN